MISNLTVKPWTIKNITNVLQTLKIEWGIQDGVGKPKGNSHSNNKY